MKGGATFVWQAVVLVAGAFAAVTSQSAESPRPKARDVSEIGRITHPAITESSGVAASQTQTNVFWTHTDGGGKKQVLYAMSRTGSPLAEYRVMGGRIDDWEDIAMGNDGKVYIGDIGNNDAKRAELAVFRVDEPKVKTGQLGAVTVDRAWRLRFPGAAFDCEALFVWDNTGYVISKVFKDARAELYRFTLTNSTPVQVLEKVATLKIDSPVTGATISADGRLLGIVAKNGAYVCEIKGEPARAAEARLHHTKFNNHIEACTFVPEGLLTTSESREIHLFTHDKFNLEKSR